MLLKEITNDNSLSTLRYIDVEDAVDRVAGYAPYHNPLMQAIHSGDFYTVGKILCQTAVVAQQQSA